MLSLKTLRIDLSRNKGQEFLATAKGRSIALGYFDGVHRGHEELAHMVVQRAQLLDLEPCMFSFDRYPKPVPPKTILNAVVVGQPNPNKYIAESPLSPSDYRFKGLIQTDLQRERYFSKLGIELLILQEFNKSFADIEPEVFMEDILYKTLRAKVVVVGENYRFSKNQRGNVEMLRAFCEEKGIELHVVPPVLAGGKIVSSTRIRQAIEEGDMEEATRLLGDPFAIPGTVIRGNAIGRTIGIPTANFRMPSGMVRPKYGVYVSRTLIGKTYYDSISNIGLRPTVNHTDPQPMVETYIFDRKIELYETYIEVELLHFLRPEVRFPSFIAMSKQMEDDVAEAQDWHMNSSDIYLYSQVNDIPMYLSRSDRYNTSYLRMEFYLPLDKVRSSEYALLANVITAVSNEYPTRPELKRFLDDHYGTKIHIDYAAINNMQKLSFTLSSVHTGMDGTHPFEESYDLLLDMILHPARNEAGDFLPQIFETEKQNHMMHVRAKENISASRIYRNAMAYLSPDGNQWVDPMGNYDVLSEITQEDLKEAWLRLITESQMRVFVGGKMEDTRLADRILNRLEAFPRRRDSVWLIPGKFPEIMHFGKPRKMQEKLPIEKAQLILFFNNLPPYTSMECVTARILNNILGQDHRGLLSQGILEDLGQAYVVESRYDAFLQCISLSVELEDVDAKDVYESIMAHLSQIRDGKLDDAVFRSAMRANHNRLLQIRDDRSLSLDLNSLELLSGRKFIGENADYIASSVEKDKVLELAKKLELQLAYLALPENSPVTLWEVEDHA